jgi:protein TonB
MESAVINELIARIERYKRYPKRARDTGQERGVTLIVEIDASGKMKTTEMAPGGNALFRRATRSAAKHLKDYRTRANRAFRLEIPVRYRLD